MNKAVSDQDPTASIATARTYAITCRGCAKTVQTTAHNRVWCSDKCRKRYERGYNAGSIKFHQEKFDPMFDWKLCGDLSHIYGVPVDWVSRSVLACREAGVSPQYFIDRYLDKKDTPMNEAVDQIRRAMK